MNIEDILTNSPISGAMQSAGMVFVIRCVPDVFTREQINIGVCAIDNRGRRLAKVITEPGRLQCLYGESSSNVVMLAAAAGEAAREGAPSPSPQIVFDTPTPFYNVTLEDVVTGTFADQVTVALPQRATSGVNPIDDEQALQRVGDALKLSRGLDMEILANTPQVLLQTDRGPRTIRVPLQPRNGVGTVRSAYYSPTTLKTHLMDSVLDMECAARYRKKTHMGLFVLRPEKSSKDVAKQLDAVIDGIAYRAPAAMFLEVAYSVEDLAAAIEGWADQAKE